MITATDEAVTPISTAWKRWDTMTLQYPAVKYVGLEGSQVHD
jgi:hypothetical protein